MDGGDAALGSAGQDTVPYTSPAEVARDRPLSDSERRFRKAGKLRRSGHEYSDCFERQVFIHIAPPQSMIARDEPLGRHFFGLRNHRSVEHGPSEFLRGDPDLREQFLGVAVLVTGRRSEQVHWILRRRVPRPHPEHLRPARVHPLERAR